VRPKRVKKIQPYGLGERRGRKAARMELRITLEEGWRGPSFIRNPNGRIVTDKNSRHDPWMPVYFFFPRPGRVKLVSLNPQGDLDTLCELHWSQLRRALSPEHLELVQQLANIAYEQSLMANSAVRVAELELDVQNRRSETATESAAKRQSPKTEAVRKEIERYVKQGVDPRRKVSIIVRRVGCSSTLVYNVLSGKK